MMKNELLAVLEEILEEKKDSKNKIWVLNCLKEGIQDFILNFVYNNQIYKKLIFTGGTCLRKIYGLPRLSEDLDFDFFPQALYRSGAGPAGGFEVREFSDDLERYFLKSLQYKNLKTKIAKNQKTVFLKFPKILQELGLGESRADRQVLFVRCDFSRQTLGSFTTEINSVLTRKLSFFVLSYDLSTLFANKIIAFLQREFFRGKKQTVAFKGRDLFDLVWFFEQSSKSGFSLQPDWERVVRGLKVKGKKQALDLLRGKVKKIDKRDTYQDLLPFIESSETVKSFSENFAQIIEGKVEKLGKYS